MRIEDQVKSDYFEWMYELMCGSRFSQQYEYRKLFTFLHDAEFVYFVPYDENRAAEGVALRYRYCWLHDCLDLEWCLTGPCSVLEMMIALAIRCEENLMVNPTIGDRTSQWFWNMIKTLGLGHMNDSYYNDWLVNDAITRFLNREYEPDGQGGLFRVRNFDRDMRTMEIWHQLLAYTNSLV